LPLYSAAKAPDLLLVMAARMPRRYTAVDDERVKAVAFSTSTISTNIVNVASCMSLIAACRVWRLSTWWNWLPPGMFCSISTKRPLSLHESAPASPTSQPPSLLVYRQPPQKRRLLDPLARLWRRVRERRAARRRAHCTRCRPSCPLRFSLAAPVSRMVFTTSCLCSVSKKASVSLAQPSSVRPDSFFRWARLEAKPKALSGTGNRFSRICMQAYRSREKCPM
jgi:hypothetical protein